jgi:hypothetical protein
MQRGPEEEVVDLRELIVDSLDEIVLDGRDGKGPCACVGARTQFVLLLGLPLE